MKKISKILFVVTLCFLTSPLLPTSVRAEESGSILMIQPRDVQNWYGSNTFNFGGNTITIAAWASMYNNQWTASASVIKGNGRISGAFIDQASSSVHGYVQVNGYSYRFSVRVYPTN